MRLKIYRVFFLCVALTGPMSVALNRLHPCSHWPLFAIAPTHDWKGTGANQTYSLQTCVISKSKIDEWLLVLGDIEDRLYEHCLQARMIMQSLWNNTFLLFQLNLGLRRGSKKNKVLILCVQPITLGRGSEGSKIFEMDTPLKKRR